MYSELTRQSAWRVMLVFIYMPIEGQKNSLYQFTEIWYWSKIIMNLFECLSTVVA
jgi:hypothetical protein